MTLTRSQAAIPPAPTSTLAGEPTFEQRWAAWEAKGAARDRATLRKMAMGAPVAIAAAGILYAVLGR